MDFFINLFVFIVCQGSEKGIWLWLKLGTFLYRSEASKTASRS